MSEFVVGSIEHRKLVAKKYGIEEQDVIDLSKDAFDGLCMGLSIGEKCGALSIVNYLEKKSNMASAKNADEVRRSVLAEMRKKHEESENPQ